MQISDKQLEANRHNARYSTGPKSAAGKRRSRFNATRHGLTGQITFMTPEDRVAHDKFCGDIIAALAPADAVEQQFAHLVAEDSWRLNHARALESRILADMPEDLLKQLNLITLYEQRINRGLNKSLQHLRTIQEARKQQHSKDMAEASALSQLALAGGHAYEPKADGFVCSSAEINAFTDRTNRLTEAKNRAAQASRLVHFPQAA